MVTSWGTPTVATIFHHKRFTCLFIKFYITFPDQQTFDRPFLIRTFELSVQNSSVMLS